MNIVYNKLFYIKIYLSLCLLFNFNEFYSHALYCTNITFVCILKNAKSYGFVFKNRIRKSSIEKRKKTASTG